MTNGLFEESQYRNLYKRFLLWMLILSAGYALVINPLTLKSVTDVLLERTLLPSVLDLVGQVWQFLIFWMAFAFVLYGVSRFGARKSKKMVWTFVGVSFLRPAVGYLVTYWMGMGSFNLLDLRDFLISGVLDSLQMVLVTWMIVSTEKRLLAKHKMMHYLPLPKLFATKNPVTPLVGKIAAVPAVIYMVTRLIYDLYNIIVLEDFLSSWDYLWMFLGYFSDVLFALIGYMVIVLILNSVALRVERAQIEFEDAEARHKKQTNKKK